MTSTIPSRPAAPPPPARRSARATAAAGGLHPLGVLILLGGAFLPITDFFSQRRAAEHQRLVGRLGGVAGAGESPASSRRSHIVRCVHIAVDLARGMEPNVLRAPVGDSAGDAFMIVQRSDD
jgi:hypothetical protein